jgi:predicted translin family RNA/ssDNA-binding protein
MGTLKPGATYIYEKADGITYAREFGAPHNERFEIGRDYERFLKDELRLWEDIVRAGRTNTALQEALERVKILYHLSKDHGQK